MENEFCTYTQSLALKELGFDEPCFGYYENGVFIFWYDSKQDNEFLLNCSAPLKQQVFRFFRDNHQLFYTIETNCSQLSSEWGFDYTIYDKGNDKWLSTEPQNCPSGETTYKTYEEAESDCLNKLIKIVNNF